MKKIMIWLFVLCLLAGCTTERNMNEEMNNRYENYIELIINNKSVSSDQIPFQYSLDILKTKEGSYIYELAIHDPLIAMYDVEMIAVDINAMTADFIAPSIGVVEDEVFNMLPFQSDINKGFYPGLAINGITNKDSITLDVLVVYKDASLSSEKYIFFTISQKYIERTTDETVDDQNNEGNE